jgi:hypothetical protein
MERPGSIVRRSLGLGDRPCAREEGLPIVAAMVRCIRIYWNYCRQRLCLKGQPISRNVR